MPTRQTPPPAFLVVSMPGAVHRGQTACGFNGDPLFICGRIILPLAVRRLSTLVYNTTSTSGCFVLASKDLAAPAVRMGGLFARSNVLLSVPPGGALTSLQQWLNGHFYNRTLRIDVIPGRYGVDMFFVRSFCCGVCSVRAWNMTGMVCHVRQEDNAAAQNL